MRKLHIDLETFSSVDIKKAGAWKYIQSPDFQILLFGYAFDDEAVKVVDFTTGERLPGEVLQAISSPDCLKLAYNAAFEYGGLCRYLSLDLDATQWRDVMLHTLYAGFPGKLEAAGKAIGLEEDKAKLATGRSLIKYFCKPCAPTEKNGGRSRNMPWHDPEKWTLFKEYNARDVEAEREIERRLADIPIPADLQKQWETDLSINKQGCAVDMELVAGALDIGNVERAKLMEEASALSGLSNPNSIAQLKAWLGDEGIDYVDSLDKATVSDILATDGTPEKVRRLLEIRRELGKTSTKKYDRLAECVGEDGRVRGLLQFYGANRTGRWAGRLVQVQNLPQNHLDALDLARALIKQRRGGDIKLLYGSSSDTLSQCIRTALIAAPGKVLIDADFSAIEARVISWLAGEEWRLDVFRTHGKIYEASASQMFGVPIDLIKKGRPEYALRAKGKVAELALGYQGGTNALIQMGALKMGLSEDELPDIVGRWREANGRITQLWYNVERAAMAAITAGAPQKTAKGIMLRKSYSEALGAFYLAVELPSGRALHYLNPKVGKNRYGKTAILYSGVDQNTGKWKELETYGGKLVENIIQAIARDCLAQAIENLTEQGLKPVFHIHDEVVIETADDGDPEKTLERVIAIMSTPVPWAPGLPLRADGWTGPYFKKD